MKQELLDAALASVNALVEDEIKSGELGRYFRAQKLCALAAQMSNISNTRVAGALQGRHRRAVFGVGGDGYVMDGGNPEDAALGDAVLGMQEDADAGPDEIGLRAVFPRGHRMGFADMMRETLAAVQQLRERVDRLAPALPHGDAAPVPPPLEAPEDRPPEIVVDDNNAAAMDNLPPYEGAEEEIR